MRTSSNSGFDLREAVDGLREALTSRVMGITDTGDAAQGDIRSAILVELDAEPMHGYQIITAIEKRSGGAWTPSAGSVYPTLQLLADEDLVTAALVGERKVYSLTEAGRVAAALLIDEAPHDARQPRGSQRGEAAQSAVALTKSGMKLAQALTSVTHSGTPEQSERVVAIIDEARRKVYAILAED